MATFNKVKEVLDKYAEGTRRLEYMLAVEGAWLVPSDHDKGGYYTPLLLRDGTWVCQCKGFRFSRANPKTCRHVKKKKATLAIILKPGREHKPLPWYIIGKPKLVRQQPKNLTRPMAK